MSPCFGDLQGGTLKENLCIFNVEKEPSHQRGKGGATHTVDFPLLGLENTDLKRLSNALVCMKNKKQPLLWFHGTSREYGISLRLYVFAKYEGIELKEVRGRKIVLREDTLSAYNITDLRKCNLFNAIKWNGGCGNLVWMQEDVNKAMSDLITCFSGDYEIFAVAVEDGGILVDFLSHGQKHYYKCNSPKEYLDLQSVLMGKCNLTKNLSVNHCTTSGVTPIPTPKETYQAEKIKHGGNGDVMAAYWEWSNRRDSLIDCYKSNPGCFKEWERWANGIAIKDVPELINLFMGDVIKTSL